MEEIRCLSDDCDVDLDQVDLKGCIRGGARHTVAYSDERCEQHRPSGPHTPSERTYRNLFVESGVECDPTLLTSAALRVIPVAGPTGNISTTGAQRGASQGQQEFQGHWGSSCLHGQLQLRRSVVLDLANRGVQGYGQGDALQLQSDQPTVSERRE